MNIGEKHIVKIIDNDSNGNGIARLHNFVIFVLYAYRKYDRPDNLHKKKHFSMAVFQESSNFAV